MWQCSTRLSLTIYPWSPVTVRPIECPLSWPSCHGPPFIGHLTMLPSRNMLCYLSWQNWSPVKVRLTMQYPLFMDHLYILGRLSWFGLSNALCQGPLFMACISLATWTNSTAHHVCSPVRYGLIITINPRPVLFFGGGGGWRHLLW